MNPSDLATALQQVLRQVREETRHSNECYDQMIGFDSADCAEDCDWQERVEAEQARRWALSIEAGLLVPLIRLVNPKPQTRSRVDIDDEAQQAALRAAQQERGSA